MDCFLKWDLCAYSLDIFDFNNYLSLGPKSCHDFREIGPWARTQGTSSSYNIQPQDTVVPKKVLPLDIISCLFQLCMKFFPFFFKFSEEPGQVIPIDLWLARCVKHLWLAAL